MKYPVWIWILFLLAGGVARAADSKIKCNGIADIGGKLIAAVVAEDGRWKWCAVGDVFEGFSVVAIHPSENRVTFKDAKDVLLELSLQQGTIESKSNPQPPPVSNLVPIDDLNWKWIASDANPMRNATTGLPDWAVEEWLESEEQFKLGCDCLDSVETESGYS